MTNRLALRTRHRYIVEKLLREHVPGAEVWAFGSRVSGQSHEGSDLDLVVRGPELKPLGAELVELIEAIRESNIPNLVQVHDWARLPDSFRREIERNYAVLVRGNSSMDALGWRGMPFDQAVQINPSVRLDRGSEYPFVGMAAIDVGTRSVFSSESRTYKGGGSRFANGDTLMARITPCLENGKIARFCARGSSDVGHGSTEFIVVRGRPDITDNDFAYYLTQWEEVRDYSVGQMTGTSGRQRVPADSLGHLTVNVPPLPEQRGITKILGTLDDKIELNRRMNETLAAMAQTLFKSWFVEFEPVRAKSKGRWQRGESLPGLPAEHYDLFPDRLVDSELGEIPEGWGIKKVIEICDRIENGGTPSRNVPRNWGGTIDWFKTSELADGPLLSAKEKITEEGLASSSCKLWEVGTVLIALYASPTVGRLGILESPGTANQACCALHARPEFGNLFLYHALRSTRGRLRNVAVGSAQQNISQRVVKNHELVLPPSILARTFQAIARTSYEALLRNLCESTRLETMRDLLLPRLIAGEIRVTDSVQAEESVN